MKRSTLEKIVLAALLVAFVYLAAVLYGEIIGNLLDGARLVKFGPHVGYP